MRRRSLARPVHTALATTVWLLRGAGLFTSVSRDRPASLVPSLPTGPFPRPKASLPTGLFTALLTALLACRPQSAAPPAPPRSAVQVLIQAAPVINPGHHGEPWPTALTIYQLRGDPEAPDHEPFDLANLEAHGDAAFGELLVGKRDYTAFPDTRDRLIVPLGPEATHLVAVAHFREPLGDAALLIFPVPDARLADPCFYLGIERSQLDGGEFPPPGFDPTAFATLCPIPGRPVPAASPRPTAPTALALSRESPAREPLPR